MSDNGGSAFPVYSGSERFASPGMTMRDYFAAKAMQGLIAASGSSDGDVEYSEELVAMSAYRMADAMLKAREAK